MADFSKREAKSCHAELEEGYERFRSRRSPDVPYVSICCALTLSIAEAYPHAFEMDGRNIFPGPGLVEIDLRKTELF